MVVVYQKCTLFCLVCKDGEWDVWSAWSPCASQCDKETMRTRACNYGERGCESDLNFARCNGSDKETANCTSK